MNSVQEGYNSQNSHAGVSEQPALHLTDINQEHSNFHDLAIIRQEENE